MPLLTVGRSSVALRPVRQIHAHGSRVHGCIPAAGLSRQKALGARYPAIPFLRAYNGLLMQESRMRVRVRSQPSPGRIDAYSVCRQCGMSVRCCLSGLCGICLFSSSHLPYHYVNATPNPVLRSLAKEANWVQSVGFLLSGVRFSLCPFGLRPLAIDSKHHSPRHVHWWRHFKLCAPFLCLPMQCAGCAESIACALILLTR